MTISDDPFIKYGGDACLARPFPAPKNAIRRTHVSVTAPPAPTDSPRVIRRRTDQKEQFIADSFQNVYIGAKMR